MTPFDNHTPETLFARLTQDGSLERVLRASRLEDLDARGDVTTASIVPPGLTARGDLVAREAGVVAGLRAVEPLLRVFGAKLRFEAVAADGDRSAAGVALGRLDGALADMLAVERTLLNLAGRLSGIATLTRRFVDAVDGTNAAICATRKTAPGLRQLDKYAVACGGGRVHRQSLSDAALFKDNHLAHIPADELADRLAEAINAARAAHPLRFVEVEVDTPEQLQTVLGLEPGLVDIALLDNMTPIQMLACVAMRDAEAPSVQLEASGKITLENARAVAETGVDRLSVGALTHSVHVLDIGLDVEPTGGVMP